MKASSFIIIISAVAATGCATKRYPMAVNLSPEEVALMDCRELYLEESRIVQVQAQIDDIAGTDWRSIAGFLGDYGIGNAMAKSEAEKALRDRAQSIRVNKISKHCAGVPTENEVAGTTKGKPTELKLAYYDAKIVGVIMPNGEIKTLANSAAISVPRGVDGPKYVQPITRDGQVIGLATQEGVLVPFEGEKL